MVMVVGKSSSSSWSLLISDPWACKDTHMSFNLPAFPACSCQAILQFLAFQFHTNTTQSTHSFSAVASFHISFNKKHRLLSQEAKLKSLLKLIFAAFCLSLSCQGAGWVVVSCDHIVQSQSILKGSYFSSLEPWCIFFYCPAAPIGTKKYSLSCTTCSIISRVAMFSPGTTGSFSV